MSRTLFSSRKIGQKIATSEHFFALRVHSSGSILGMGIHVDPDDVFHVLLDGVVTEMTLDALADAHEGGLVREETLLWQEGLGEWLRLDVVLASLEEEDAKKSFAPPVAEPDEMYAVLMGANEVKQMSLDQLNDAYRLSIIDDETSVWQPGFSDWLPLHALLGEEEAPPPSLSYAQPSYGYSHGAGAAYATKPTSSFAPMTYSVGPRASDILPELPIHPPTSSPWFQRTLVFAGLVAVSLVFIQNGALHQALGKRTLASAGTWMPQLSLDTPQGTSTFLENVREKYGLSDLAETAPIVAVKASKPAKAPATEAPQAPVAVPPAVAPPGAPVAPSTSPDPGTPATPSGDLRGQVLPLGPAKPSATPPKKPQKARSRARSGSGTFSTSNDPYDPMNGTL